MSPRPNATGSRHRRKTCERCLVSRALKGFRFGDPVCCHCRLRRMQLQAEHMRMVAWQRKNGEKVA